MVSRAQLALLVSAVVLSLAGAFLAGFRLGALRAEGQPPGASGGGAAKAVERPPAEASTSPDPVPTGRPKPRVPGAEAPDAGPARAASAGDAGLRDGAPRAAPRGGAPDAGPDRAASAQGTGPRDGAPRGAPRSGAPDAGPRPGPIAEPKARAPPPGRWGVQVGAYPTRSEAEELARELADTGLARYVLPIRLEDRGRWFRVRVGAFRERGEAVRAARRLRQRTGRRTLVVQYP